MRWASAISDRTGTDALDDAVASVREQLGALDVAIVFASPEHARAIAPRLAGIAPTVIGCSGAGIIGDAREIEDRPALSITAAELPEATCAAFRVEPRGTVALDGAPAGVLVLADPFTSDVQRIVADLDAAHPRAPKFGGLVSGGRSPGTNWLYANGESYHDGAVGIAFGGALAIDTVVAQGCRPIGAPMVVTRAEGNLIHELDQQSPLVALEALHASLSPRDRQLFRHSLFVGIEMTDSLVHREGELLVRNIVGLDHGALVVAARLQPYQVVRFLLRDAETATEDLSRMLERRPPGPIAGALLFSCLGRGERLFGAPDHDSQLFRRFVGTAPVGGFFCNGEIGPVGGTTFVHGYTSAFALFRRS